MKLIFLPDKLKQED